MRGLGVDDRPDVAVTVPDNYDFVPLCRRLSKDFGDPIYQQLEVGPQSRKARRKRALTTGGTADVYKAILMAIAATGPTATISYESLRSELTKLIPDDMPQKHEITSALKHLAAISRKIGSDAGLDWNQEERKVDISDPYLRFYLRWQVRPVTQTRPRLRFIRQGNFLRFLEDK